MTALICMTLTTFALLYALRSVQWSRDKPRWIEAVSDLIFLFLVLVPFLYFWYSYFGGGG